MKLGDFLPNLVNKDAQLVQGNQWLGKLYDMGFTGFMKAKYGSSSESVAQYYGVEQLYFDWLRQAYSYRRMFIQDLYLLAFDSAEIRTPLLHLKNEIFRKGFDDWKPKFIVRCTSCGEEYQEKIEVCECGNSQLEEPDPKQYHDFDKKWKNNCNIFGQSFESVLRTFSDDLNIVDDAFLHINKQYKREGEKLLSQVLEIRRIHPALMEIDLDKNGLPKNSHWVCPFHRDNVQVKSGTCSLCEKETEYKEPLQPAMYAYNHRGAKLYMLEDEIVHLSKFSSSETYGYSPILTIMQKILTISGMDRFLYRYFFERKTPTQLILTNTDDPQSLEVERARIEAKMMEDPTYTPWIAVSNRTGRGRTDVIRLFHTLQEMDYLNVRNEIRDRISAMYGVPQMFMNVMEGVGGLSGQTQQLKMMSNVVQSDQRLFNENVLPVILKYFGITDWEISLRAPEEKVEGQVIALIQQKVGIAQIMRGMGFEVALKADSSDIEALDFTFSGKAISMQEQMGGMGGALGGPGSATNTMGGDVNPDGTPVSGMPNAETPNTPYEEFAPNQDKGEGATFANDKTPEEDMDDEDADDEEDQSLDLWN